MIELFSTIKQILPELCKEWNEKKLPQFESLVEKNFKEYFAGKKTQEKTKMVAPILDVIFARLVNSLLPDFKVDEGVGRDYNYKGTPLESKITFCTGNTWTGNGFFKTPVYILLRFDISDDGIITDMFACSVDLSVCKSAWTIPEASSGSEDKKRTHNFSGLALLAEDLSKINQITGTFKPNKKFLRPQLVKV
jgi:hypothetical protein